jgi:hypothetical protein
MLDQACDRLSHQHSHCHVLEAMCSLLQISFWSRNSTGPTTLLLPSAITNGYLGWPSRGHDWVWYTLTMHGACRRWLAIHCL